MQFFEIFCAWQSRITLKACLKFLNNFVLQSYFFEGLEVVHSITNPRFDIEECLLQLLVFFRPKTQEKKRALLQGRASLKQVGQAHL